MAKIEQGVLGGFSGTVGAVVGAHWRNKDIIRARPKKTTKEPTESQLLQRAKFRMVSRFLQPVQDILNRYFGSRQGSRSRLNLATSYTITEAVEVVDGLPKLIFNKVMFTKSNLTGIQNGQATPAEGGILNFTWMDNSTQANASATDVFCVVLYHEDGEEFFSYETESVRTAETAEVTLPGYMAGETVEAYAYFRNEGKTKACNSLYLGSQVII